MPARSCWTPPLGLLLLLLLVATPGTESGCARLGRCCAGRSLACTGTGWRPDGSHGPCYCDQACARTLDCCHDYRLACPEVSCMVSEWSAWSSCAEPCKATYRVRRRHIIQESRNGGEACPPLEEKAGCWEYWTRQGTECKKSFIPALITTGGYGKARKKRAVSNKNERTGYCVEFQLMAITEGCLHGNSSYTHWMKYLSEGHTVCVECQHPAQDSRSLHCSGDGSGAKNSSWSLQVQTAHTLSPCKQENPVSFYTGQAVIGINSGRCAHNEDWDHGSDGVSYCSGKLLEIPDVEGPGRKFVSWTFALAPQFTASCSSESLLP